MANSVNNQAEPAEVERAQQFWHQFTEWTKVGTIAVLVLLALMAVFLV